MNMSKRQGLAVLMVGVTVLALRLNGVLAAAPAAPTVRTDCPFSVAAETWNYVSVWDTSLSEYTVIDFNTQQWQNLCHQAYTRVYIAIEDQDGLGSKIRITTDIKAHPLSAEASNTKIVYNYSAFSWTSPVVATTGGVLGYADSYNYTYSQYESGTYFYSGHVNNGVGVEFHQTVRHGTF